MSANWTQDPGFMAILAMTFALGAGFIYGTIRNRHLQEHYLQAIRPAVLGYARHASARRLGTSGYHIIAPNARPPFKKIDVLIYLQPRELSLYWLFNRLRGRGDRTFIQIFLQKSPSVDVLAGLKVTPPSTETKQWKTAPSPWGDTLYTTARLTNAQVERLRALAELLPDVQQMSIQHAGPHINIITSTRFLEDANTAKDVFRALAALATAFS